MATLLSFNTWWADLSSFVKVFYIIAVSSSLILLVQLIFAMFGFGDHGDAGGDAGDVGGHDIGHDVGHDVGHDIGHDVGHDIGHDVGHDVGHDTGHGHHGHGDGAGGLRLFTVQTIISFLVTFGWSGVAFGSSGMPWWLAFILAFIIGTATLFGMAKLMQAMMKLQSSGNIDVENAVGLIGEVYIPVPANEGGIGKVSVTVQERLGEYNAITKGAELLKTGVFVKVVAVVGTTLVVEKELKTEN